MPSDEARMTKEARNPNDESARRWLYVFGFPASSFFHWCFVIRHCAWLWIGLVGLGVHAADEPKAAAPQPIAIRDVKRRSPIDFESDVLPILKANCLACHNQTSTKADLVLETPQTIRKG